MRKYNEKDVDELLKWLGIEVHESTIRSNSYYCFGEGVLSRIIKKIRLLEKHLGIELQSAECSEEKYVKVKRKRNKKNTFYCYEKS